MNLVEIMGHLGTDAEERTTPSGQKVISFRMATNSRRGGKEETIWWRINLWGDRFSKLLQYLKKGRPVILVGEMSKPEIYTDREGQPQVSLTLNAEILKFSPFGGGRDGREGQQGGAESGGYQRRSSGAAANDYQGSANAFASMPAGHSGAEHEDDQVPF